jgi:hypothetical protein
MYACSPRWAGDWIAGLSQLAGRIQRLKAAGLKAILISVNPFYAEYVPFAKTERCIRFGQAGI